MESKLDKGERSVEQLKDWGKLLGSMDCGLRLQYWREYAGKMGSGVQRHSRRGIEIGAGVRLFLIQGLSYDHEMLADLGQRRVLAERRCGNQEYWTGHLCGY